MKRRRGPNRRRVRTAAALAVVLTAAACGAGRGGVTDGGPAPTGEPGTDDEPGGVSPATAPDGATVTVSLYLTRGDTVQAVKRTVPKVAAIGAETVKALLGGPTPDETKTGLGTAIPAGTRFLGLTITDGVAQVDLSRQFGVGAGDEGFAVRLAQLTCTLDQFDSVKGVRFALDGKLTGVQAGDGSVVDRPVTCDGYRSLVGTGVVVASGVGIWPYTSAAESETVAGRGDKAFTDPAATAREFSVRYLGMDNPVVFDFREGEPGAGEVGVGFRYGEGRVPVANPRVSTNLIVRQLGRQGAGGPWTVTAASAPNIEVRSPQPGERVSSPVRLSGRASTFEGNVGVVVREDGMLAGASLGEGNVSGRGDGVLGPFDGEVMFRSPARAGGAVLFVDRSAADGSVLGATVVRVTF